MSDITENEKNARRMDREMGIAVMNGSAGLCHALQAGAAALRQLDKIDSDIDRCVVGEGEMPSAEQPTLRDQFAMAAVPCVFRHATENPEAYRIRGFLNFEERVAEMSYSLAEAMLAARKTTEGA